MLRSLTGYGYASENYNDSIITVEIKSINHKYLDLSFKMPKILNKWEMDFRNIIRKRLKRGRINIFIDIENPGNLFKKLNFDIEIAKNYYNALKKIGHILRLPQDISLKDFLFMKGIFEFRDEEIDEALKKFISDIIENALDNLIEMKFEEGKHLQKDILERLEIINNYVNRIDLLKEKIVEVYKKRLEKNIEKIFPDNKDLIDEKRIEFEIVLYSDKADINEEIIRLKSHIEKFLKTCKEPPPVGKKLDFILQEMNREINTIGAKNNISEISEIVIETKNQIERIREQIQNIE